MNNISHQSDIMNTSRQNEQFKNQLQSCLEDTPRIVSIFEQTFEKTEGVLEYWNRKFCLVLFNNFQMRCKDSKKNFEAYTFLWKNLADSDFCSLLFLDGGEAFDRLIEKTLQVVMCEISLPYIKNIFIWEDRNEKLYRFLERTKPIFVEYAESSMYQFLLTVENSQRNGNQCRQIFSEVLPEPMMRVIDPAVTDWILN